MLVNRRLGRILRSSQACAFPLASQPVQHLSSTPPEHDDFIPPPHSYTTTATTRNVLGDEDDHDDDHDNFHEDSTVLWNRFTSGSRFWKDAGNGRKQRPIFVAATRQHVGKTTSSLALMSGLIKRYPKVGFLKPVRTRSVYACT
jgi:hypothetical protein